MIFIILIIGVLIVAVAYKGTQQQLFSALSQDIPKFGVWAAAIVALGIIGFIPGLKPISRGLLGLVILVIIMNNYEKIISGFKGDFVATGAAPVTSAPASNGTSAPASSAPGSFSNGLGSIGINPSLASADTLSSLSSAMG